jgi:CHAT domain-containing protein
MVAQLSASTPLVETQSDASQLVQQGKAFYVFERFKEAAQAWQQAADAFAASGDKLNQAMALSNLSSALERLGQWDQANQIITESLNLLQTQESTPEQLRILAQTKDIQGQLQRSVGQSEDAIYTWQQAADLYARINNKQAMIQSQINQAQAMQDLGLYPKACKTLLEAFGLDHQNCNLPVESLQNLTEQSASPLRVLGLRSLGDVLRVIGKSEQSQIVLEENLKLAQQLNSPQDMAATYLSLGNTVRTLANTEALAPSKRTEYRQVSFNYYQQAAKLSTSPTTQLLAQLNQLSLLLEINKWSEARELALSLKSQLNSLPLSRTGVYAQINFAQSLMKLGNGEGSLGRPGRQGGPRGFLETLPSALASQFPTFNEIDQILETATKSAHRLGDQRTEAYAHGLRGRLYEHNQQWSQAENFTKRALTLAPAFKTPDIAYELFWQLGRLRKAQGDNEGALVNYTQAVNTLQSLRSDLVTISSDVQFSFRESVEPVYRELVGLLLKPKQEGLNVESSEDNLQPSTLPLRGTLREQPATQSSASQKNLVQARKVLESLQLAELDNFFRDACINAKPAQIDQIDKTAAVFYPIILSDRLEVILALPGQLLHQYTTFLTKQEIDATLKNLRQAATIPRLRFSLKRFLEPSQQVYNWLIRPVEAELAASGVKTLAFVPDGAFRNIPIAALYDGKQYLIEKYSVAIAPGLQLVNPKPLAREKLQVLAFGLSEARQGFAPLPNVKLELERINAEVESQVRLNQDFTNSSFKQATQSWPFPVIHLATHGKFSSSAKDTFVLTWDGQIKANDFNELIRTQGGNRKRPIELLVLSACQTAEGDDRAALGLAGVAVRAGARSTLASLWFVSDEATSLLMAQFYQELTNTQVTKAEALRRAQVVILRDNKFSHPFYWSAFVLVGNWL